MSDRDDWSWVLTALQEEFGRNGQAKSAEESVIATSLTAIRGPQREAILALFRCLVLVPEDTHVPLEVVRIMFEAVNVDVPGLEARPSLLNIRRWLK